VKDVKNHCYRFGDVEIDSRNLRVTVGSEIRPLEPKSFRLLLYLVENPGRILPKEEIMAIVWPDAFVSDNSLARAITQIRKALDDDPKAPRYIETVPSVGYRFLAEIREAVQPAVAQDPAAKETPALPTRRPAFNPWIVAAASVVFALAAIAFVFFRGMFVADMPEVRSEIDTPPTSDLRSFALSPDGRQLAYVATADGQSRLWVRQLASTKAQPLTVTEGGAAYPFWSPDSRFIGYFSAGKMRKIDAAGGSPQIVTNASSPRGGTWNADGVILFAPTSASALFRVPAAGGEAIPATNLGDTKGSHRFPQFLPDGKHFLYYDEGFGTKLSICLGTLGSREARVLTKADSAGLYLPPGWLLWVRAGILVAKRLDITRGELSGDTVTVADPVLADSSHARLFSVSATGLVTYRSGIPATEIRWFDRAGKTLGSFAEPAKDGYAPSVGRLSPDGKRAAISRKVRGQNDYWLIDETHASRFTFNFPGWGDVVWSADGRDVAIDTVEQGSAGRVFRFYSKAADGSNDPVPIGDPVQDLQELDDWSPDGKFFLYQTISPATARDLWTVPLEGDHKPHPFAQTKFDEKYGRFSPDGRWVAYTSNVSGRAEIYVKAFSPAEEAGGPTDQPRKTWQVSVDGGLFAAWRRDGKEVYWVAPGGKMMAASVNVKGTEPNPAAIASEPPVELF
jgi:DNA-binding winged helix-turn-helix (wHTH) protein/Tol biopolymer transport system component